MRVGANLINGCVILHIFNLIGWAVGGDEFCLTPGSGVPDLKASLKARTPGNQNLMQTSICAKIPMQTLLWTAYLGKLSSFEGYILDRTVRPGKKNPATSPQAAA